MDRNYLSEIENGGWHASLKIIAKLSAALKAERPARTDREPAPLLLSERRTAP